MTEYQLLDHEQHLSQAIHTLSQRLNLDEIILFGSYSQYSHEDFPDIDLICTTEYQCSYHTVAVVDCFVFDLFVADYTSLQKAITADVSTNNNYILFGCANGTQIRVSSGLLAPVAKHAQELWQAGPKTISSNEAMQLRSALIKVIVTLYRIVARFGHSDIWNGQGNVQISDLFLKVFHTYCRVHRLWSCSPVVVLRWNDERYRALQVLAEAFFETPHIRERCSCIIEIAELALTEIDRLGDSLPSNHLGSWSEIIGHAKRCLTDTPPGRSPDRELL